MVRRFDTVRGKYVEPIPEQRRFGFAHTDSNDLYDLVGWAERGGYPGSTVLIYDFETGRVYEPFQKERDVLFVNPAFADGEIVLLRGDYKNKTLTVFRWLPQTEPRQEAVIDLPEAAFSHLTVIGEGVNVVSHTDGRFTCYYPERLSFPVDVNEYAVLRDSDRLFFETWVEEGWDDENDCATEDYNYYHLIRERDLRGNLLTEQVGSLTKAPDGTWWIV